MREAPYKLVRDGSGWNVRYPEGFNMFTAEVSESDAFRVVTLKNLNHRMDQSEKKRDQT